MENAVQALIIAGGVLIGVILLSMAAYLGLTMSEYAAQTQDQIDRNQVSQFNQKFMNYDDRKDLTIQDVITVKNYALENNKQLDYKYDPTKEECRAGQDNGYIDVFIGENVIFAENEKDLEKTQKLLQDELGTIFSCNVEINSTTGRVNKITFKEYVPAN